MSPSSKRRGIPNPRAAGRAFWIGLAVSLAVHGLLITKGQFPAPRLDSPPALEAQLEVVQPPPLPPPVPASKPAQPAPPQDTRPPESQPESEVSQTAALVAEPPPAPQPPEGEPLLPLSTVEPPPVSAQPLSLLAQAAESIRRLPARIEIVYELKGLISGRQTHVWQIEGQRYSLEATSRATGLAGLFVSGEMVQTSRGRIGPLGLMPERYEMQRFSGKKEILRFDYIANSIESSRIDAKHGTRKMELPLLTGAQDPLSSVYQLAMAAQDDKNGFIVAASAKRVKGYPYRTLGMETLRTPLGELDALHIVRAGDSDKGGVHLWLAPAHHSLPVRVTYVDDDGAEWVLEAVSVTAP